MKILELRFKNLNSLYGEWAIDFTDPEYGSNGIFALTGPTGAGKSTVLDAICLALYGATPRLGKITQSGNEIMSRQTGECYSEVMFESQAGRFRCFWGQHRAYKKADGKLADARHEISDETTGKPIETKKSLVPGVIEEKTGMDFDRFTRSILLAQGGFDTFLKADTEQKSRILEQITGTEIYTEISRRVHERLREERDRLTLLQAETSGIEILTPEQEKEIRQDLALKETQETEFGRRLSETGKAIEWFTLIDGLKKEIASLAGESDRLQTAFKSFELERKRLDRAITAAGFDGEYATLTAIRKQQAEDQSALRAEQEKLPALELSAKKKLEALKKAERRTARVKQDYTDAAPLIQKVRSLDQKLVEKKKTIQDGERDCQRDTDKIQADRNRKVEEQIQRDRADQRLKAVEEFLTANSRDEWLVTGLTGIEEQIRHLLSTQEQIRRKEGEEQNTKKRLQEAAEALEACTRELLGKKQKMGNAAAYLAQEKKDLDSLLGNRLLREFRAEKEGLLREMAFLARIAELETLRSKLEDGSPCPLCGAKEHPFAQGNVPVPDDMEQKIGKLDLLIQKAETRESNIQRLEAEEKAARGHLHEMEKRETIKANEKTSAEKHLLELGKELEQMQSGFTGQKQTLLNKLIPLGIKEIPDSNLSSLMEALEKRLEGWQARSREKLKIEKQILDIDNEIKRLNAVTEAREKALAEKKALLDQSKKEYGNLTAERKDLYKDKNPDTEEKGLQQAIAQAEQEEKQAGAAYGETQKSLHSAQTGITSLKQRIEKRSSELIELESVFSGRLKEAGFFDEAELIQARLPALERERLQIKAKDLDERQRDLSLSKKDRETRLALEIERKESDQPLKDLEEKSKEIEKGLHELRESIAGLRYRLIQDQTAKSRIKEKLTAIESRKKECQRWEKLHGLIGSADGKKYRNFAQGLTFELMVSHANRQLEKMTDRYLLMRDRDQPLELNVVDNYQAGEIRSTRNLSGGESFIVSLALALGLSKMASQKVRVDSLFLDEGFGTLDEEALETALETLSGLHQDGKLIGIISHVSALKERISAQISILPLSGGKSAVIGPGCRKIARKELTEVPG